ncbi:hypothetical protein HPB47_012190 [Ixodes persulcatus]|uniref:Uncharacterized protein n=1 Tax=Ixodes persulcatus TaxID=34615 RepID=A0AC60NU93_IXOPE|nr:hypothetical protein HPB47_012190 [Ixodes persulcatus]
MWSTANSHSRISLQSSRRHPGDQERSARGPDFLLDAPLRQRAAAAYSVDEDSASPAAAAHDDEGSSRHRGFSETRAHGRGRCL